MSRTFKDRGSKSRRLRDRSSRRSGGTILSGRFTKIRTHRMERQQGKKIAEQGLIEDPPCDEELERREREQEILDSLFEDFYYQDEEEETHVRVFGSVEAFLGSEAGSCSGVEDEELFESEDDVGYSPDEYFGYPCSEDDR